MYGENFCFSCSKPQLFYFLLQTLNLACEDDLAATSVTPLIARVDWADLAG